MNKPGIAAFAMGSLLAMQALHGAQAAIRVDGKPDEIEWQGAQMLGPLVSVQPFTQAPPKYASTVRMLSTPEGLAFAFDNRQPADVTRIKTRTQRDQVGAADRVNVMLDFDGDGKLGYDFTLSLSDSIDDYVLSNENQFRGDWDGDWQHAVAETAEGWTAELLIPWSTSTMRSVQGETRSIGVYVDRVLGGTGERYAMPAIRFTEQRFLSQFARVDVAQYSQSVLNWFPYVTVLSDQVHDDIEAKIGLDVFWKPSGTFQLTAAINPDFGQVESDDLVVNFSALETFFSDKRPFFTENQAFFDIPLAQGGSLIYTRRMGGPSDDGNGIADIDAALKASGSFSGINYGVFGVLESDHADDLGSAFYATRVQKPGDTFTIGYAHTYADRPYFDRTAFVQLVDMQWNPLSWMRLTGFVLQSDVDQAGVVSTGESARAALQFTPANGFFAEIARAYLSDDLDLNDMGFMPRNGLRATALAFLYPDSSFDESSRVRTVSYNASALARETIAGDDLPTRFQVGADLEYRNGATQYLEVIRDTAGVDNVISRGNGLLRRDAGNSLFASYNTARIGEWKFGSELWHTGGGIDMDAHLQAELSVTKYFSDTLDLRVGISRKHTRDSLIWQHDTVFGRFARDQAFSTAQLNWFPAPRHELRAKAQWLGLHSSSSRGYRLQPSGDLLASDDQIEDFVINNFGLQIRYRFEIAPQSDFFAVYSRGGDTYTEHDRDGLNDLFDRAIELRDADQIVLKLRYRF